MNDWTAAFEDRSVGYLHQPDPHRETVLVAFGGLNNATQGLGIPPFEFFNLVSDLPVGKIFVRDVSQAWYHAGVEGLGQSISAVATTLAGLVSDYDRAVFVGHSAGGYGALLFGALIGVDEVVATSPQTFVSRRLRRWYRDPRWAQHMATIYRCPTAERRYFDISPKLLRSAQHTRFQVHYSAKHRHDPKHARRLRRVPNVELVARQDPTHSLVRVMRDEGTLTQLLHRALRVA